MTVGFFCDVVFESLQKVFLAKVKLLVCKIIPCLRHKLFWLKIYDKGIVQNTLNYMSLTKKLFFRRVPRSEIKRSGVTFRFKSNEFDQTDFKNLDLEKKLRLIKIIVIFSLFTKMMQHVLLLKKPVQLL